MGIIKRQKGRPAPVWLTNDPVPDVVDGCSLLGLCTYSRLGATGYRAAQTTGGTHRPSRSPAT